MTIAFEFGKGKLAVSVFHSLSFVLGSAHRLPERSKSDAGPRPHIIKTFTSQGLGPKCSIRKFLVASLLLVAMPGAP